MAAADAEIEQEAKERKREINHRYRESHREQIRAKEREWREKNREKLRDYHQKYYWENRDNLLAKQREYRRGKKFETESDA